MKKSIHGLIKLSRPLNVIIGMLSIILAGYLCGVNAAWIKLVLASISGGFVTISANAINDYFDLEIDHINKPYRPLPSGQVTLFAALTFACFCGILGLLITVIINKGAFFIVLFAQGLLFLYSAKIKKTVLWGNLTVSFITGLAFIFGGIAVGNWRNALIPAGFAFLMHLGREIIKDMEDVIGDKSDCAKTLPVMYGYWPCKVIITGIFVFLIGVTFLPYFFKIYGMYYLVIVIAGVDTVLFSIILTIWLRTDRQILHRLSELLKIDMLIGLVAIYAGRWR